MPTYHSLCANMWRITKYDPALRNQAGHYTRDEWTFFAQIGDVVAGEMVIFADYFLVEDAYVSTTVKFVDEAGIGLLAVTEICKSDDAEILVDCQGITTKPSAIHEGLRVSGQALEDLIRLTLREVLWCKLVGERFYIHFGWDYYMYIGCNAPCVNAIAYASNAGLFVESFRSPYLDTSADKA